MSFTKSEMTSRPRPRFNRRSIAGRLAGRDDCVRPPCRHGLPRGVVTEAFGGTVNEGTS